MSWHVIQVYFVLTRRDDLESVQTESRSTAYKPDIELKIQDIENFKQQLICLYTASVIFKNIDTHF
jgi:hypothetical protein